MDPEKSRYDGRDRKRRSTHASTLLRTLLLLLRILILLCSLYLLGLFIFRYIRRSKSASTLAILILSAISSAWSFFSLFSTCFGHSKIAGVMALVDAIHIGAMVAVSVLLRDYAGDACSGLSGTERRDCQMLRAAFGIAVGLAALYAIATLLSVFLLSAFRRGRPYGPSPDNGYHPDHNRSPGKRRGFITPDLPTNPNTTTPADNPGFRHSTYTTNSALTDGNHTVNDGSVNGRDSTADTVGLLNVPPATYGQQTGRHSTNRPVGGYPTTAGAYEPYRSPTPVGAGRNNADFVEMPGERDYGAHGYNNNTRGGYGAAF